MEKLVKLGHIRNNGRRVWLEGKALREAGFVAKQTNYTKSFNENTILTQNWFCTDEVDCCNDDTLNISLDRDFVQSIIERWELGDNIQSYKVANDEKSPCHFPIVNHNKPWNKILET